MPQKQKLGMKEKVRIVEQCLKGEMGISEASRKAGILPNDYKLYSILQQ